MSVCGQCSQAGQGVAGHCGWCTCCSANRTGNVGGGRSPMAGNQRSRGGCPLLLLEVAALVAFLVLVVCG